MEMTTARNRPTYAAAPLRFVAFEVQFGFAPTLGTQEGRAAVYERLRGTYPLADAQLVFQVPPVLAGGQPGTDLVMIDPARTRSVTIGPNAMSLQTTAFTSSDELVEAIEQALVAVEPFDIPAVRRVGLRFVDEIRISEVDRSDKWEPFIDPDLLGMVRFAGEYPVVSSETQLVLRVDEDVQAIVRYGPREGFAVDPRGRLRLPDLGQGQFFLLDVDMAWQPPAETLVPLTASTITGTYRRLQEPSQLLFERAITDRARERFREGTS
jgi:uncharacterized protein (TIGR04255 family)